MRATDRVTFRYSGQDEVAYRAKSGDVATIVRPIGDPDVDVSEVGPMWRIRFEDGVELDAFESELRPAPSLADRTARLNAAHTDTYRAGE